MPRYRVEVTRTEVFEIPADDEKDLRAGIADGGYLDRYPIESDLAVTDVRVIP